MADRVPLSTLYRDARERVTALVSGLDEAALATPVAATPGWTIHDVVAHLAGVAHDISTSGPPPHGPTPEWTAVQVDRGRDLSMPDLLEHWAQASAGLEAILATTSVWAPVLDAGSHELDLRATLNDTSHRDTDLVLVGAKVLLRGLAVPAPLRVVTEHHDVTVGPDPADGTEPTVLRSTTFEVFRWRLGRRSRAQLAAMDFSADPTPFLDHLMIFGPAEHDLVE